MMKSESFTITRVYTKAKGGSCDVIVCWSIKMAHVIFVARKMNSANKVNPQSRDLKR